MDVAVYADPTTVFVDVDDQRVNAQRVAPVDVELFILLATHPEVDTRMLRAACERAEEPVSPGAAWKCLRRWRDRGFIRVVRDGHFCFARCQRPIRFIGATIPQISGASTHSRSPADASRTLMGTPNAEVDARDRNVNASGSNPAAPGTVADTPRTGFGPVMGATGIPNAGGQTVLVVLSGGELQQLIRAEVERAVNGRGFGE